MESINLKHCSGSKAVKHNINFNIAHVLLKLKYCLYEKLPH